MPLVNENEWETAERYLSSAPNGQKLAYSVVGSGARTSRPDLFKEYQTTHSFIKINNEIFFIHRSLIGSGAYGRVKYIENRRGELFVVKIESEFSNGREQAILYDLGLSNGSVESPDTEKNYTQIKYLGLSLDKVLEQPQALDEARRFRLAISLCASVHRLHHGLDSRSGKGYAHLDLKSNNCTVDEHDNVHLIDFGAAEAHVDSVLSKSMGTYVYAPPVNHSMTKYQYDSLALARTLYWSRGFHSADGYSEDYDFPSVLTKKMIDENGLDELFNKSARYRPTLESFIEDKTTPLMYAARLVACYYHVAVSTDALRNNRLLCLVLLKLHESGADASEIRLAANDLEEYLIVKSGRRDSFPVIKARTLNAELKLGVEPGDLAEGSEKVLLINHLDAHDLLMHWKTIELFSRKWRRGLMNGSPEFLRAVKMILDETHELTSNEAAFRRNCLKDLFARPELAGHVSANVIKARRYQKQFNFEHFSRFPQAIDTILLNAMLKKYALLPYKNHILEIPSLPDFILSPWVSERFMNKLRADCGADCVGQKTWLDMYRKEMPLVELLHRRGVKTIDIGTLNEEYAAVVRICDRVLTMHSEFQRTLNQFFYDSARYLPGNVNPVRAVNALADAGADNLVLWLRRMRASSPAEAARIYIRAACLLAEQGASSERYNEVLNALESSGNTMEALRHAANEICGRNVCDQVMVIRPYAVGNHAVAVQDEEPVALQIIDPRSNVLEKLQRIGGGLDWLLSDFIQNTPSLNEFNHLLSLADSEDDVFACLRLCEQLDALRRKGASFAVDSEPWLAFQRLISNVSGSIATRFEKNTNPGSLSFDNQCRLLYRDVSQHINEARPVLGGHRGLLGWVDSLLAALASLVCLRPGNGASPHAFFQTRSNILLNRFEHTAHNMLPFQGA
ncbi:protein kinase domain-containing protein [Legionella sp. CNM-4043-24]|uniref:protein kinase domain-containing protein n=1 Tax=Legionella sp. CNM-4043-24 TaxID=3421646 RepID=UPI00403ACE34